MISMISIALLLFFHFGDADHACKMQGGNCVDWRNSNCHDEIRIGLCDGDLHRRCCLDGNSTKLKFVEIGCFGDIMMVDTTGASRATASQDKLPYAGVRASHTLAYHDLSAMAKYKSLINEAGAELCVDPAVIAGIISRESRAGKALRPDGFGYDGHGFGLMQVDNRYHTLEGGPYSLEHIKQGTGILIGMIKGVGAEHRDWTQNMDLKGGICAYNSGIGNVQTYKNMDVGTTGGDYSNDVTARSQYYKNNGY